jgi:site-specific DNA-adenine methylase
MKNHFITSYSGNKRAEVKEIYPNIDFKGVKYIVEPYCGSSAMSYYISTQQPKKFTYILNDTNKPLMKLYEIMKDEIRFNYLCCLYELQAQAIRKRGKEHWKLVIEENTCIGYLIQAKFKGARPCVFPYENRINQKNLNFINKSAPIIDFMRNEKVIIKCKDALDILEECNEKKYLLLCDPPYMFTCNTFYSNAKDGGNYNIYEHIVMSNKKYKCKLYFVLEYLWIVKAIFTEKKIIHMYDKSYTGYRKKKVKHCILKI